MKTPSTDSSNPTPILLDAMVRELKSLEERNLFVVSQMIHFLKQQQESETMLSEGFMNLSSDSLWQAWDNDADSVYDDL